MHLSEFSETNNGDNDTDGVKLYFYTGTIVH